MTTRTETTLVQSYSLAPAPSLQTSVERKSAQERPGHADISGTLNTCIHVLPEARAEVARKSPLENLLLRYC
jgi:hypothetical protein